MPEEAKNREANNRIHERTELGLTVRFITREDLETTGTLIDISAGGLSMLTETEAKIGDPVIAYPDRLGRLTGKVVRKFEGGVAVQFEMSDTQREHLRKRIESALSGVPYLRLLENRKHKRITLNLESECCVESSGEKFKCHIMDISETGSKIQADQSPEIGETVRIGSLHGVVIRHIAEGFAIEFSKSISVDEANAGSIEDCA
ncbi:MAG: PilZ domain-containing protein [Alphaproteobacteria bacterium]|nr:PilZ domain-containing protein [Alphaproteobacteria bacterium]